MACERRQCERRQAQGEVVETKVRASPFPNAEAAIYHDILSKWTARLELRTPASVPRRSLQELQHRWRYLIELDKAAA